MKDMKYMMLLLLSLLLCNCIEVQAQMNIEDMDEDDWMNMRDTTMLSRRNRTKDMPETRNAMNYILDDRMTPEHEDFSKSFLDHIYFGASLGVESLVKEEYTREMTPLAVYSLSVGKELTRFHSIRASLTGGTGFVREKSEKYYRYGLRADYFYNITNHFNGYSSTRPLEVSLNAGVGAGYRNLTSIKNKMYSEAHVGLQFKIYTGPFASFTIEPYFGYTNDGMDFADNWRGYDMFYGISASCMLYAEDNLSRASRQRLLENRLEKDRLIDRLSLEKWRTPWFIQLSMGGVKTSVLSDSPADGKGNVTTLSVGRWMSSVIGLRGSVGSRISRWYETSTDYPVTGQVLKSQYNTFFMHGRAELLFNPLGFMKNFSWDNPFGAYLFGGMEYGQMRKYSLNKTKANVYATGYTAGLSLWFQLSRDLRVFVEPHYSVDSYELTYNHKFDRFKDKTWGLDLGMAMLIRSSRYRDPEEFDAVQNFNYRHIRGLSIGVAAGGSILQRRECDNGHEGFNFSGMAYAEYRFNHLHAVRLSGDMMRLNGNIPVGDKYILRRKSDLLVAALDYQLNLTNLLSGRFRNRTFSLEMFLGPAYATVVSGAKAEGNKKGFIGGNLGMKLSVPVCNGLTAILQPNFYALNKAVLPTANPIGIGDELQLYQNVSAGLQFDVNYFVRGISEKINKKKAVINANWKARQKAAIDRYEKKQRERIERRHAQEK